MGVNDIDANSITVCVCVCVCVRESVVVSENQSLIVINNLYLQC